MTFGDLLIAAAWRVSPEEGAGRGLKFSQPAGQRGPETWLRVMFSQVALHGGNGGEW